MRILCSSIPHQARIESLGGKDGDDHDHGSTDPHAWLDPDNARVWLGVIRDTLAKADPEHAEVYAANAAAADASIAATDAEIKAALAGVTGLVERENTGFRRKRSRHE